ncbi:Protein TRANSPARENT TESTA 12 [Acorus gramineus]|uniref:Protein DETOXIFICATION n=1 Tax=Acorus gramineus TaxID=55184 RepID=A0AAV9A7K4_ACOGR|nr:Protein TRANSPARENT TESTA 12 [Acorus gramineus]
MDGDESLHPMLGEDKETTEEEEELKWRVGSSSSLWKETCGELKMLWYLAGPAILTSIFQYSLSSVTETMVGHIGTVELAAVGVQNLVIAGIGFGVMLGMGSALETLCGQAFGAGDFNMLGIYLQRSWIILLTTAFFLSFFYIFSTPILKILGTSDSIAEMAGRFSIYMLPELYAYAINFPIQKFLQAQSKVMVMTWISAGALVLHLFLSWLCIVKLGLGIVGAAITLDVSWVFLAVGQLYYIMGGGCKDTWTGFSWLAFSNLAEFLWLSLSSAVMLCLEYWSLMQVLLFAGLLKNPEIEVGASSICLNVDGWIYMIPVGFLAAISVRVSNELGAGRPKAAKFSVLVVVILSMIIQTTCAVIILLTRYDFPVIFTDNELVKKRVSKISVFLCLSILIGGIQPVFSGVAVGAGWQTTVAYINIGCYYLVGLTSAFLMGLRFGLGLEGVWGGLLLGMLLQTIILLIITLKTDWEGQVSCVGKRKNLELGWFVE